MKFKIKVYDILEVGQRRDSAGNPHQEDCIFPRHGKSKDSDRLFILCDGMGGHDSGEVASSTVCRAMSDSILAARDDREGEFTPGDLSKAIDAAFLALDVADTGAKKKMGTTMTLLKLYKDGACVSHMGDSRVYHIRPGKTAEDTQILFRTRDHSLVSDLVEAGEITEEEAAHSPQKNIITRAMQPGLDPRPSADVKWLADIRPGDYFYLCSDGMLEEMNDRQLCYHFSQAAGDDNTKVANLIKATAENRDNHSAIIVHITDVEGAPETVAIPEPSAATEKTAGGLDVIEAEEPEMPHVGKSVEAVTPPPIKMRRRAVESSPAVKLSGVIAPPAPPRRSSRVYLALAFIAVICAIIFFFYLIKGDDTKDKKADEEQLQEMVEEVKGRDSYEKNVESREEPSMVRPLSDDQKEKLNEEREEARKIENDKKTGNKEESQEVNKPEKPSRKAPEAEQPEPEKKQEESETRKVHNI